MQRGESVVPGAGVPVVDQQAHPDAAVGGLEQAPGEDGAGGVRVPDVGLHVEAAAGGLCAV